MDGFVPKPFTLALLAQALAPWLAHPDDMAGAPPNVPAWPQLSASDEVKPTPGHPAVRTPLAAIDSAAIETLLDLDECGDLLCEVLSGFLDGADERLAAIEAAIAGQDTAASARGAHALTSSAYNVGARALAALYGELERGVRSGAMADAGARLDEIRREQARVAAELRGVLKEFA